MKASDHVHLDPDLQFDSLPRKPGWRPLFGQAESAQSHLDNSGVAQGDIFLFFGWFRRVEARNGHHRFVLGAADVHMFFGWLEVGAIWRLWEENCKIPVWASDHPHIGATYRNNTIYVAAQSETGYHAGVFRSYSDQLVLTAPNISPGGDNVSRQKRFGEAFGQFLLLRDMSVFSFIVDVNSQLGPARKLGPRLTLKLKLS